MCTTSHSLCLALYSQKVYLWSSDLFVLLQIQDLDILNIALQAMEQDKLWTRYFESLMVSKFSLDSEDSSQSIKVLSDLFSDFQQLKIHRRVIELHAYIKYCGLDSKLLCGQYAVYNIHGGKKLVVQYGTLRGQEQCQTLLTKRVSYAIY